MTKACFHCKCINTKINLVHPNKGQEGGCNFGSNSHLSSTTVPANTATAAARAAADNAAQIQGMNPVYESYHQQFTQLQRQHSSPMGQSGPSRQLPMAPFGHRRTQSGSFVHSQEMIQDRSPGNSLILRM